MKRTNGLLALLVIVTVYITSCSNDKTETEDSTFAASNEQPAIDSSSNIDDRSSTADITNESIEETKIDASSGSENWDNVLNHYEKYVDDYIKFYKKAMKGDQNAIAEYSSLLEKANDLQTSLNEAKNDNSLSTEQARRMLKIQTKMLEAMQSN